MKLTYQKEIRRRPYVIREGLRTGDVHWEIRTGTWYHLYAAEESMDFDQGSPFMDIALEKDGSRIRCTDISSGMSIPFRNHPKNFADAIEEILGMADILEKAITRDWYKSMVQQCERVKEMLQ